MSIHDIPSNIQSELNQLNQDLDQKIPSRKVDKNLLIATWNIRAFGDLTRKWKSTDNDTPKRDLHSIQCIAQILKRFDIVAIQEVKANLRAIRDTLKILGNHWSLILTDVNREDAGNGERMAYIFDTRRVKMSGLAAELVIPQEWLNEISDKALTEQFVRNPYAVSFKINNETFILVTLHIKYGKTSSDRIKEIKSIAKWMSDWAKDIHAYHQNFILLGDFNIDKRGDLLNQTFIAEGLHIPEQLQNKTVLRSIFNETKYYDQIAWFQKSNSNIPQLSMKFLNGGHYDFLPTTLINRNTSKLRKSWMISDHYPLWVEFELS